MWPLVFAMGMVSHSSATALSVALTSRAVLPQVVAVSLLVLVVNASTPGAAAAAAAGACAALATGVAEHWPCPPSPPTSPMNDNSRRTASSTLRGSMGHREPRLSAYE